MLKNRIRILVSAIALLALTGCNLPFMNKAADTVKTQAENAIQEIADKPIEGDEGLQEEGGNENAEDESQVADESDGRKTDGNECMKGCAILNGVGMFSKEFCEDSCWAAIAEETKDVSICDTKISKENGLVLYSCYITVAEATKDAKYCEKIGENPEDLMRAGCVSNVAKIKKDPSVCDPIKGGLLYESCVLEAKGE